MGAMGDMGAMEMIGVGASYGSHGGHWSHGSHGRHESYGSHRSHGSHKSIGREVWFLPIICCRYSCNCVRAGQMACSEYVSPMRWKLKWDIPWGILGHLPQVIPWERLKCFQFSFAYTVHERALAEGGRDGGNVVLCSMSFFFVATYIWAIYLIYPKQKKPIFFGYISLKQIKHVVKTMFDYAQWLCIPRGVILHFFEKMKKIHKSKIGALSSNWGFVY